MCPEIGSWEWDVEHDRLTWSSELLRIYGVTSADFGGNYDSFIQRVHPDDRPRVREIVERALREGGAYEFEERIVRSDGQVRLLHSRAHALRDQRGHTVMLAGTCADITERREQEYQHERWSSLLRATLESTADGILVVDREGKIVTCNALFAEMWQVPPELLVGRSDERVLAQSAGLLVDPDKFLARVRELYANPDAQSFDVLRFRDGRVVERFSRPQRLEGKVVGRVWSFRDETEREALLASERESRSRAELARQRAMLLADSSRLLASLDYEAALAAVAQRAVPLLGDGCAVDLADDNGVMHRIAREAVESSAQDLMEATMPAPGSATIYGSGGRSYLATPLVVGGRTIGSLLFVGARGKRYGGADLALSEDLAGRAALAIENARLYRGAREALRLRQEFLSIASHELRGPATSLQLGVQMLLGESLSDEQRHRILETAERQVRQVGRFVDELLDASRIQAGRLGLELEPVDLVELVREVVAHMEPQIVAAASTVSVHAPRPVVGHWDRARLDQVVTNLLSNAIKFGAGRSVEITVDGDRTRARLAMRDHGIGVVRERQEAIFEPFERAVSARHFGGLGLGLYIVRRVLAAMGGTVRVDSEPGEGATFICELPLEAQL